jgi:hypothetical protein
MLGLPRENETYRRRAGRGRAIGEETRINARSKYCSNDVIRQKQALATSADDEQRKASGLKAPALHSNLRQQQILRWIVHNDVKYKFGKLSETCRDLEILGLESDYFCELEFL